MAIDFKKLKEINQAKKGTTAVKKKAVDFAKIKKITAEKNKKREVVEPVKTPDALPVKTASLSPQLGGGQYKTSGPGSLILSPRSQDALDTKTGSERDHKVSVALGGTSELDNLQYLENTKEGRQSGKVSVEQQAIKDYQDGKISLPEARAKIAQKNQQILGLAPTLEQNKIQKLANSKAFGFVDKLGEKVKGLQAKGEAKTKAMAEKNTPELQARTGLLGRSAMLEQAKKDIDYSKTPEGQLKKAQTEEKMAEKRAQIATAPVRFVAGFPAAALTSYALEKAGSDKSFTPKTDAEKLIIGDQKIERLLKSEDLYGMIARGSSVPVALGVMAILENPFVAGTGLSPILKGAVKRQVSKLTAKQLAKMGTEELIKYVDDIAKAEIKAQKLAKNEEAKLLQQWNNAKNGKNISEEKVAEALTMPAKQVGDMAQTLPAKQAIASELPAKTAPVKPVSEYPKIQTGAKTKYQIAAETQRTLGGAPVKVPKGTFSGTKKAVKEVNVPDTKIAEKKKVVPEIKVSEPEQKLISEAKKYKTADEFAKAQDRLDAYGTPLSENKKSLGNPQSGDIFYHGTVKENKSTLLKKGFNPADNKKGFAEQPEAFFVGDMKEASMYGDDVVGVRVKNGQKIKTISRSDFTAEQNSSFLKGVDEINWAKNNGYDAINAGDELIIVNPKKFEIIDAKKERTLMDRVTGIGKDREKPTKAQLTDIWNKANKTEPKAKTITPKVKEKATAKSLPVKPEPKKPEVKKPEIKKPEIKKSKLYNRVVKTLRRDYREDVVYKGITRASDTERAIELIEKDPNKALRIAKGLEKAPTGQTDTTITLALAEKARMAGEYKTQADLIKRLSLRRTKSGQEIEALKGIVGGSPESYMKKLINMRLNKLRFQEISYRKLIPNKRAGALPRKIEDSKTAIKSIIEKKKFDLSKAQSFIDSITCK